MTAATADQAEARLTLMLDYGNPDPAGEPIPASVDDPKAKAAPDIGKRQAILDQGQTGKIASNWPIASRRSAWGNGLSVVFSTRSKTCAIRLSTASGHLRVTGTLGFMICSP